MNRHIQNQFFINTSQGKIAIWDSKPDVDSPSIVFIHGHCTNKSFFSYQMLSPNLAEYRLICMDLPGYGESDPPEDPEKVYSFPGFAEIVVEVIHLLKLKNIIIVGWSLGGHIAIELTTRLDQLQGLLITGAPPIAISAEGLSRGFKIVDLEIQKCFGKGNLSEEEAERMATLSGYDYTEKTRFIVDAILKTDEGAKVIYPRSILNGIGQNEIDIVSEWLHPIAVVVGENDRGINNDYIINEVKFRNLWKNKVQVILNSGHAVHMEQPEEFNSLLKEFLKDVFNGCDKRIKKDDQNSL